jgi:hypothetical protein
VTGRPRTSLTRRDALLLPFLAGAVTGSPLLRRVEEVRRFGAPEANQAVAVDAQHFYAIGNHVVAKYEKATGKRVSHWECERGRPLVHLNSGVVRAGVLYCAHSTFPEVPMTSSVEMWDTAGLRRAGAHSFGIFSGSATWLDSYKGHWYVTFAHYGTRAAEPNRDPRWTNLVQFDAQWRRLQGWVYPPEVVSRLGQYSISGGVFGPDGAMYCTGHDNPELYVLNFPEGGSTLALRETVAIPAKGQGIAWDPAAPDLFYGIDRAAREVIVMRLRQG